jgi:potassium efflux system protein
MTIRLAVVLFLLLAALWAYVGAADQGLAPVPPTPVSAPTVEARIAEAESDPGLAGEAKTARIALYRQTLSNLREIETYRARADAFEVDARTAPAQTEALRERTAVALHADTPPDLGPGPEAPLDRIEDRLKQAQADQAAAQAQHSELERQLAYLRNRPAPIRQRLKEAAQEQDRIAAALQSGTTGEAGTDTPLVPGPESSSGLAQVQARRWVLETGYLALGAEIEALDRELIALPLRLDLIAARRDAELADAVRIGRRVEGLKALAQARRKAESRQAQMQAERMVQATAGLDPALARLAGENAALVAELAAIAGQGDRLDGEQQEAERMAARTQASLERMQTAKEVGLPTEGLGALLLEERAALPDVGWYILRARDLGREIATVNLSLVRHRRERERLADAFIAGPSAAGTQPPAVSQANQAAPARDLEDALTRQRLDLLDRLLAAESQDLERLRALSTAETQVLDAARSYDTFLREQLFWLPTGSENRLADLATLPEALRSLLSPDRWSALVPALQARLAASPGLWLALSLSMLLAWKRGALVAAIRDSAAPLASPATDGFRYTLKALLLSLAFAAPLPLALGALAQVLLEAAQVSGLSLALGDYLTRPVLILYAVLALRAICLPGGLAIGHFRWPESDVQRFEGELRWLGWTLVPVFYVLYGALGLDPVVAGGPVARVAGWIAAAAMGLFFYRLLHPSHGVLRRQRQGADPGLLYRAYWLWFPLLLGFPVLLVALAWSGYIYTTHLLADTFFTTLGLVAALMLLHALAVRWLTLARRRLALQAARQRQQALSATREEGPSPEAETPDLTPEDAADLDLEAASADGLELAGSATAFAGALGLYLIWSAVFPALGILQDVTLWQSTATLDGVQRARPITLADLGLALVYLGVAAVLARRLPALLNLILAQHNRFTAGSRYTITTLTTYAVVATGTLLALNAIGAQWSQLQWLVAALGVGIGFGLQEIVANFISGIIILFERPIRVGDVVTVGDTDGVVTRIRIRATTIRNWDRKELLVPNKEFITGRLLNWSLSDQVTRIMVTVGVAYGTDVEEAHALMREAAQEHGRVLADPAPTLSFEGFGDNALTLILRAFIDDLDYRLATITDLHQAIYKKFQQAGIGIAYPQRDLHLDTRGPLRVSLERSERGRAEAASEEPGEIEEAVVSGKQPLETRC